MLACADWKPTRRAFWLVAATAAGAVWASAGAAALLWPAPLANIAFLAADFLRMAVWAMLLLAFLPISPDQARRRQRDRSVFVAGAAALIVFSISLGLAPYADPLPLPDPAWAPVGMALLAAAVVGLVLAENLLRNSDQDQFWRLKFVLFAIGGVFVLDFIAFSHATLFRHFDPHLQAMRGVAVAFAAPLFAVAYKRASGWAPRIHVSRKFTFHFAALFFAGAYLLLMAGAGYYVRLIGGRWGEIFLFAFACASAILFLLIMTSGRFRAAIKRFVNRHFYSANYDYGAEWRGFLDRIEGADDADLGERVIGAVATVFEIPDGLLWTRAEDEFRLHSIWNRSDRRDRAPISAAEVDAFCRAAGGVRVLETPPPWLAQIERTDIFAPLWRRGAVIGFLVLSAPRDGATLNEEDLALLDILTRQAGSYLAEGMLAQELSVARKFAEVNRRMAYMAHDLKNIASQLTLTTANARKFANDPDFVSDMIETIENAAATMQRMLEDINRARTDGGQESPAARKRAFDIHPVLNNIVQAASVARPRSAAEPRLSMGRRELFIDADPDRFAAAIRNLLQNALDASAANGGGEVSLSANAANGDLVIEIEDRCGGMTPEFVRDELFKPFRSTKTGGYGLGAFEAREFAKDAGGRLEVDNRQGVGAVFRMILPLSEQPR